MSVRSRLPELRGRVRELEEQVPQAIAELKASSKNVCTVDPFETVKRYGIFRNKNIGRSYLAGQLVGAYREYTEELESLVSQS